MTSPYDGTPEGIALGLLMDDDARLQRFNENLTDASMSEGGAPSSPLHLIAFLLGASVVIFVMLYGSFG